MPILSTVSRNGQANVAGNVHGCAEGNPRLTLHLCEKLGARNMTASWCEGGYRREEHGMMSSLEPIGREIGQFKGWRAN